MMKLHTQLLIAVILLLFAGRLSAQQPDTIVSTVPNVIPSAPNDSLKPLPVERRKFPLSRFLFDKYPNPRAAALLGVVPGLGQAYNKKYWKIPIVYAALGTVTYFTIRNTKEYHAARDNYRWLVDGDASTTTQGKFAGQEAPTLLSYRNTWQRYSELSYLGLGLTYLLSVTDAFVDAHLATFDVSDDLTLRMVPKVESVAGPTFGLGVQLKMGERKRVMSYEL